MDSVTRHQRDSLAEMQRSLVPPETTRLSGRRVDGAPVYEYLRTPGSPPVSVLRFSSDRLPGPHETGDHAHSHAFLVLAYFERGEGTICLGDREWPLNTADAFVIAPGEVVRFGEHGSAETAAGVVRLLPARDHRLRSARR